MLDIKNVKRQGCHPLVTNTAPQMGVGCRKERLNKIVIGPVEGLHPGQPRPRASGVQAATSADR